MSKIKWNEDAKRFYELGVEQPVLYVKSKGTYQNGVPWDGLTKFSVNPTGGEATPLYANDVKYGNLYSSTETEGSVEAYAYPKEFEICQGSKQIAKGVYAGQQPKEEFGFCCKTLIGNDVDREEHGYYLHVLYNALATPSQIDHETINKDPNAITMSWNFTTTPAEAGVTGVKPTAYLRIDSRHTDVNKLKQLEDKIYGTDDPGSEPTLPTIKEIVELLGAVE